MRSTALTRAEIESWRQAAEQMYVPRHEQLGIVLQDEHFLERERWDLAGTPPEKHPLLLHYHPLELYRHQVIKQTDVVLATYLVEHNFGEDEMRRTFDYYDPLTTGDSTLSACVQSVIASAVGYPELAMRYFKDACAVDLLDTHGNTADGIHIACCGGTWLALVAGFGGLRDYDGELRFHPRLPVEWQRLRFKVQARGQLVEVDMTPEATTYRLLEGHGILVRHFAEAIWLRAREARPAADADRRGHGPPACRLTAERCRRLTTAPWTASSEALDGGRPPGLGRRLYAFMRRLLATDFGGELYAKRQGMIEPIFANTKFNRRIDRFLRRGRSACRSEWRPINATHNLMKLHRHHIAAAAA